MEKEMNTEPMTERRAITKQLYDREIEIVVRFCAANRGTIKAIHEAYQRRLRTPINRDCIDRWLSPHRERRTQPLYGAGKLLLLVAARIIAEARAGKGKV